MLGFVIGTLCLFGLIKVLRWGRHGRHAMGCGGGQGGCGGSYRHGGWGGHHGHHGFGDDEGFGPGGPGPWGRGSGRGGFGGMGRAWAVRQALSALDTTPGQEKVIRGVLDELFETMRGARREVEEARAKAATALRGEVFDETALGEAGTRVDEASKRVKASFEEALRRIHEVLDPSQRDRLASMIESGFGRRGQAAYL